MQSRQGRCKALVHHGVTHLQCHPRIQHKHTCRANVRALVRDPVRTKQEFGPYVTPIQGDSSSGASLQKAMKGSRAIIIVGPVGQAARAAKALGMEHIVLLSSVGAAHHDPFLGLSLNQRSQGRPTPHSRVYPGAQTQQCTLHGCSPSSRL